MKIPDWLLKTAEELKSLSDKMMKDMIPMFVEKEKYPDPDHKCGNCFTGGTLVHTPSGKRPIRDIQIGDEVISYDIENSKLVVNKVTGIKSQFVNSDGVVGLFLGHNRMEKAAATLDHKFLSKDKEFRELSTYIDGDELFHITREELTSLKMRLRNPMKDKNVAMKSGKTFHKRFQCGEFKMPQSNKQKEIMRKKMYDNNPMHNPSIVAKAQITRAKNKKPWGKKKSKIEQMTEEIITSAGLPVWYCGSNKYHVKHPKKKGFMNPDFKVHGQKKIIETYWPGYREQATNIVRDNKWAAKKRKLYEDAGFKCLTLALTYRSKKEDIIKKIDHFVHNGLPLKKRALPCKNTKLFKLLINNDEIDNVKNIKVYDIECFPNHNFVLVQGVVAHNCNMRVEGEVPTCTIVNQNINLQKGTCLYWAGGEAAAVDKIHEERMDPATGGYIEVEGAVNCSTCHHFKNNNYCALWMGAAAPEECCMAWSSGQEEEFSGPPQLSE